MITLHGFAYSNYYNIIKHVLLYKNIPFTESLQYGANEQFLEISPAGKIPAITTDQGIHLSESSVCCDYLEDAYPKEPLYPANNEARAQARQIMKISELYLEQPCRRLIPFVFTQTAVPKVVAEEVRNTLSRGIEALIHLCVFTPYLTDSKLTMADIYLHYVMNVVDGVGSTALEWNIGAEIEGLKQWQTLMAASDIAKKISAEREANREEFFATMMARVNNQPK